MSVYTTSLVRVQNGPAADAPFFSPVTAENTIVVVRDISLMMVAGTLGYCVCCIKDVSGDLFFFSYFDNAADTSAATPFHWEGRQVLNPGEAVGIYNVGAEIDGQITGYVLSNYS